MDILHKPDAEESLAVVPATTGNAASAVHVPDGQVGLSQAPDSQRVRELVAAAERQIVQSFWLHYLSCGALALSTPYFFCSSRPVIFPMVFIPLAFVFVACQMAVTHHYKATMKALTQENEMLRVGLMINHLADRTNMLGIKSFFRQSLLTLLPRLKSSDANLLTPSQKRRLAHMLDPIARSAQHGEFQIAILRALEQVGDKQAIPVVERIVERGPGSGLQRSVHAAAVQCLPFLVQRAEQDSAQQTLLRATAPDHATGGELLRPAHAASKVNAVNLLQAAPIAPHTEQQGFDAS